MSSRNKRSKNPNTPSAAQTNRKNAAVVQMQPGICPRWITISLIAIIAAISIFELRTLRLEYDMKALTTGDWHLHHDEKLAISDSRYFFLKDRVPMSLMDYRPYPISAAFGVAAPQIQSFGFRLFGMNNVGLRFFFVLSGAATALLLVLTITKISPNLLGFIFSLFYLLCYNNFILNRHAIIENFLALFLFSLIWLYVTKRDVFLRHIGKICFISGASLMLKINFPAYVFMFIFISIMIESPRIKTILKAAAWSVAGLIFFELIQLAILWNLQIAQLRYENLSLSFSLHTGKKVALMHKEIFSLPPSGWFTFLRFPVMLLDWYGMKTKGVSGDTLYIISAVFLIMSAGIMLLSARGKAPKQALTLSIFLAVFLAFSCNFYFYPKRAAVFYPLALLVALYLFQNIYAFLMTRTRNARSPKIVIRCLLVLMIIPYAYYQFSFFVDGSKRASTAISKNSEALDGDLPAGSVIYAHCYGYRFFWQEKNHRMISCDDQIMTNQMILDWALQNGARYVLFSGRECAGSASLDESPSKDKAAGLKILKKYVTDTAESDLADKYSLVNIIYR